MIHKKSFKTWLVFLPVILAICILAGCAAKLPIWGDSKC
jgi:hypothetical protein